MPLRPRAFSRPYGVGFSDARRGPRAPSKNPTKGRCARAAYTRDRTQPARRQPDAADVLDRPTLITHPDSQTEATTYSLAPSPQGVLLFKTEHTIHMSPANRVREQYADHLGRMRAFVEHPEPTVAATTTYDYTANGELAQIVDAEGNQTTLGYDLRGLRTSFANPDTGLRQDSFDLMGNRITSTTPNLAALGAKIEFQYDRNRLSSIDYPSKPDVSFIYGAPNAGNHAAGRLLSRTDETGTIEYVYGAMGEIRETHRALDGPGIPATNVAHRFTYDSLGRQLQLEYPDGEVITNTFDAAGQLAAVVGAASYASNIRYDVYGNRTRMDVGKVSTTWTFDPVRVRLTNTTSTLLTAGQPKIQNLTFGYDGADNPISITNALAPLTATSGRMPGSSTTTYAYDGVDRLISINGQADLDGTQNTTYSQTFSYSTSHNVLSKARVHTVGTTTPPGTNFSSTYSYSTRPHLPDQIGGLSITYDASGNPIVREQAGKQQELIWDDDDRLVDFTDEATDVTQHNVFDADGLRVLRVSDSPNGSHTTIFASPYFDIEDGTNLKHVFAGGTRVASYVGTALYFLHSNHLGSTGVVTDVLGNIHQSIEYFADGETWIDRAPANPVNGYLFNGKPFDSETGLYDYGQRFYDPRTSLWLGVDPAFTDSAEVAVGEPSMLASGAFSGNSPAWLVDPDGRCPRGRCPPPSNPYMPSSVAAYQRRIEPMVRIADETQRIVSASAKGVAHYATHDFVDMLQTASNFVPQGRVLSVIIFAANEVIDYLQGQSGGPVDPTTVLARLPEASTLGPDPKPPGAQRGGGDATVRYYQNADGSPHFTVEVDGVHTHHFIPENGGTVVQRFLPENSQKLKLIDTKKVSVTDVKAGADVQTSYMSYPNHGTWNRTTNSCSIYVCQVLRAAGAAGVPKHPAEHGKFLRRLFNIE